MPTISHKTTNLKRTDILHRLGLFKRPFSMRCDYRGDGIGTKNKSLDFLGDEKFIEAWEFAAARIYGITGKKLPDIRWRAHIALWAASAGLTKDGDFVECGVFTGIYSSVICRYLDFAKRDKRFWLFDTWEGIPTAEIPASEKALAAQYNRTYRSHDIYEAIKENFSDYPNCHLVRGFLPGSLDQASIAKIAYLSVDLNNATYEKACIEALWPKIVSGGLVVIDDYNFTICKIQRDMWDSFATGKGLMIAALPTGQGLLIKP